MSTSTVSVTANPRRRTVTDVTQSIDIVKTTTAVSAATSTAAVNADDKVAAATNVKDLSHSIGGEAVLESSSKETTSTATPSNKTSSGHRTRHRKPSSTAVKQLEPRWKTILSVVMKNLVLVAVLAGLIQMVSKLTMKEGKGVSLLGFSDMEGRIEAVEKLMKTTTKMLQVQVEVVDKKIDSEVGNLRREVGRRVEDKGVEIEGKLRELESKSEGLEAEMGELRDVSKGFVSKEDVVRIYDELKSGKRGNSEGSEVSLDEIRGLARGIVEKEIEKHAADGLGLVDYAVASGGGRVVKHSDPLMAGKGNWFAATRQEVDENAVRMLIPSFGEPGMCFALKGNSGFVQIRLRTAIVPEAITLEHVAKSVAYDQSSAPKSCQVFGLLQGLDTDLNVKREKMLLAEFTYDLEKSNAQTYNVLDSAKTAVIDTVILAFTSNHGSPTHTCIYRLRVHGHDPKPVPKIA